MFQKINLKNVNINCTATCILAKHTFSNRKDLLKLTNDTYLVKKGRQIDFLLLFS